MSKKFFTSDWHVGENSQPNTHSFLRPRPTETMVTEWINECHQKLGKDDTLYFLGDLAIQTSDLEFYCQLPQCRKILILGDKEYANKNFIKQEFMETICKLNIFDEIVENYFVKIEDVNFFVSHKPEDCLKQLLPSLCGHVHGIWRSAKMPNNAPIINVGIDAWGGLVSENFIIHQYDAITKFYDMNAFPNQW